MSNLLTIILACKDGIVRTFRRLRANGPYVARPEEALPSSVLPQEVLDAGYYVPGHVVEAPIAKAAIEETTLSGTRVIYPADAFAKAASQQPAPTEPLSPHQQALRRYAEAIAANDGVAAAEANQELMKLGKRR